MKRNRLIWFFSLLFCCTLLAAQKVTVEGTVTGFPDSEVLMGASVSVKGTTQGTITDLDGKYSLSVASDATLVFSYLGYETKEVAVKNRSLINVSLKADAQDLEEVVVVGTILKKSDLTGAVSSVSAKVLEEKPVTNINQALQGRVAGVFISNAAKPGDDATIKIRGINTINGSTDPIYVIDGQVMDNFGGGFNSVNLNDVASIEVLKDASATALYGSRASNGVILVTTKKGKNGIGKVTYDGWVGFQTDAKLPKTMGTKDLFELRKDAAMNSFTARHPGATEDEINAFLNNRVMKPYSKDGSGGYVFAQYEFDAYNNNDNYNWLDAVTRTGVEQNHALSFSGASEKGAYYFSLGYSNKTGMVENLGDKRYSGRINSDYAIKSWLKVGTNTAFTHTDSDIFSDDGVYDKARGANPMLPINSEIYTLNYGGVQDDNYFNPIRTLKIENNRRRNRLSSTNFLNINPIKGLNIRTSFSIDYFQEDRFKYTPKDIQESIRYSQDGQAEHTRDQRMTWQWDNSISYDRAFGEHKINALFSTSATQTNRDYTYATGKGFGTDKFSYNIGSSYKTDERSIGSDFVTSTLMSYVVRANYNYASKYYLTATARYDGSSKFAEGKRWGLFPSFSAAWNIAEENFMKEQDVLSQLKLRLGYGLVGNQNIDDFAFYTLYDAKLEDGKVTYVPKGRRGTKDITWESQRQFNVGVDMGFLNGRITASLDAFLIKNKDLLMTRSLPLTSGFSSAVENIGAIENKGIEFSMNAKLIETRDFLWNFSANISADKNKVTQLYGHNDAIYKIDDNRNMQKEGNLFLGESRNTIYIWRTGGIAQVIDMDRLKNIDFSGRQVNPGDLYPLDVNDDKVIDDKDRVIVGSPDPKFYGGFSTDLSYKGITLNAVFNYSYGAKKLSPYYESLITSRGTGVASVDLVDRWSPENTDAKFPRPIYNDPTDTETMYYNTFSASQMDFSVQNASYLRLSTLSLAYTFPKTIVEKMKIGNLRVYSTISNVFCWTSYKGYDPETGDWYPPTRMFVFGLSVSL